MEHPCDDLMSQELLSNTDFFNGHLDSIESQHNGSSSPANVADASAGDGHPRENGDGEDLAPPPPAKKTKRTALPVKRANNNGGLSAKKTPTRVRAKNGKHAGDLNRQITELQEQNEDLKETLRQTRNDLTQQKIQTQLMSCQLVSERQDFFSILDCYHHKVLASIHANKLEDLTELTERMNDFRNEYTKLNQKFVQDVKTWIFQSY